MLKRAVFLDRDGTIIADRGYLERSQRNRIAARRADTLRMLMREGWKLIIIGNQSGVGRGLITQDEMNTVQAKFLRIMRGHGVEITASYFCIHSPDEDCECRKPSPFPVERAAREH